MGRGKGTRASGTVSEIVDQEERATLLAVLLRMRSIKPKGQNDYSPPGILIGSQVTPHSPTNHVFGT